MRTPRFLATLACLSLVGAQQPEGTVTFRATTRLVILNVTVTDSKGRPVEGLTRDDFEILEDGKPQQIAVFEFQRLEPKPESPATEQATPAPAEPRVPSVIRPSAPGQIRYRDRRLLVLYFDFAGMSPEYQVRAREAAERFIREKMSPVDMVAVMAFANELRVLQDFTDDRDRLLEVIRSLRLGEGSEMATAGTESATSTETESEESTSETVVEEFVPDETEFSVFNTDRRLSALALATQMLASLPEKKALIYFSSGVSRTGVENESQLRATVNSAIRANVSFYPIDVRGLIAEAPLGGADVAAARGTSLFSGQAARQRRDRFVAQQETLFTLAADTGGKALLDSNDLVEGMIRAQQDISSYYILGYYPQNQAEDGKYRRVQVRIKRPGKFALDYRRGYFAPKSFEYFTEADRERQLEEALLLDDPITDLRLVLEVDYFRRDRDRYLVPVVLKLPGSQVRLAQATGAESTRFDFIGQVRDARGWVVGTVRDHIPVRLQGEKAQELAWRNFSYDTVFTLPPGRYSVKFVVRENVTGKIGTFETRFEIPELDQEKRYLPISSVVWANQREPLQAAVGAAEKRQKLMRRHPLVMEDEKLIPSITRVFRRDQKLHVYFEVYGRQLAAEQQPAPLRVNLAFYQGDHQVWESDPVEVAPRQAEEGYLRVNFAVPLDKLPVGRYVCQLNVIDPAMKKFAFRRTPFVLLPARAQMASQQSRERTGPTS